MKGKENEDRIQSAAGKASDLGREYPNGLSNKLF
jgi:hypothetical protein